MGISYIYTVRYSKFNPINLCTFINMINVMVTFAHKYVPWMLPSACVFPHLLLSLECCFSKVTSEGLQVALK